MKETSTQSNTKNSAPVEPGFPFGRFDHAFDAKKRLTVPAAWRELLGYPQYLYVIRNPMEMCLTILAPSEMRSLMEKRKSSSLFDPKTSAAWRYIGENSEMVSVDSNGRIRISDRLMNSATLKDKVVFIGMGGKMEIWPAELKPAAPEIDGNALLDAFVTIGL